MRTYRKAKGQHVTIAFLNERYQHAVRSGYGKAKWIEFCEVMLGRGYNVFLTETGSTRSKYVRVRHRGKDYLVRFSDHRPSRVREEAGHCDFFVGKNHLSWTTTAQAIKATIEALESCEEADQRQPLDQNGFLHAVSTPSATAGAELDRAGGQTQETGVDHGASVEP
jgi:hypothetical protein